jgi:hypothetical protein
VSVTSPHGQGRKLRPAVVIDMVDADSFLAVAGSTSFPEPLPNECVLLPWHPEGKVKTKLKRKTVAVCNWMVKLGVAEVREIGGFVPPEIMKAILEKIPADSH